MKDSELLNYTAMGLKGETLKLPRGPGELHINAIDYNRSLLVELRSSPRKPAIALWNWPIAVVDLDFHRTLVEDYIVRHSTGDIDLRVKSTYFRISPEECDQVEAWLRGVKGMGGST